MNGWVDGQAAWFCLWMNDVEAHGEGISPQRTEWAGTQGSSGTRREQGREAGARDLRRDEKGGPGWGWSWGGSPVPGETGWLQE